jgi:YVTN family beta-propeller protein
MDHAKGRRGSGRSRRHRLTRTLLVLVVVGVTATLAAVLPSSTAKNGRSVASSKVSPVRSTTTTTTTSPLRRVPSGPPADQRTMSLIDTIGGAISPKSVSASDTGLVFAQNMMYRHTMTVYNSSGGLVTTIPDTVDLSQFGVVGHPGVTHGAPVEAAFTPDAKFAYVSNYSMYGAGQGPEGSDTCTPESARATGDTPSYVYRVNTSTLAIDQVIQVGLVPKFLQVTPDDRYVLVANWCSWDLSVIDVATAKVVATLPMGAYPRGVAVSPDSSTAYVAIMGGDSVVRVNLANLTEEGSFVVGENPRHLVMDPAGRYLYASLNAPGEVVKVDLTDDQAVGLVHTGVECRSLAISTDGTALYVVNYRSNTITKLRASDLSVLQTISTGVNPIGITYDATTGNVWVAVYTGQILVFADR